MLVPVVLVAALLAADVYSLAPAPKNMNGEYLTSQSTNLFGKQTFNTDFASKGHEYFDVYSPEINSTYGMVYWTQMKDVSLPLNIKERFDGKVIAITGYEMDQVLKDETSVPINWAYNHHYVGWIQGKNSEMVLAPARETEHSYWMRGDGTKYMARTKQPDADPTSAIPTSQIFAEGNGGESRKSFHGYPDGVAQLVESPVKFVLNPMQIDTYNRDLKLGEPFKAGPLPPEAESPQGADYSGLLECPCTDRLYKQISLTYSTRNAGTCGSQNRIYNATKCFDGIKQLENGIVLKGAKIINDPNRAAGCTFDKSASVGYFNNAVEGNDCGGGSVSDVVASGIVENKLTGVQLNVTLKENNAFIQLSGPAAVWFGVGLNANQMSDLPYALIVSDINGKVTVTERKLGSHAPGSELKPSIKVISNTVTGKTRTVFLQRPMAGRTDDYYTFDLDQDNTIPVILAAGSSLEFAYHKVHDSTSLSLFNEAASTCVCNTGTKGEICGNTVGGCIPFGNTGGQDLRGKRCPDEPLSDLAKQGNSICTVQQYQGGLRCCHHKNILLSKTQNPWPGQILSYRMKFRFWFQEYKPETKSTKASHLNLVRFYWQTESFAGEYNVPKGSLSRPGTRKNAKGGYEYQITSQWQVEDMVWGCDPRTSSDHCTGNVNGTHNTGIQLRYAGGHCHAPSCAYIELSTNATGEWKQLCRQLPHIGEGKIDKDKYDEKGYIALPPCLWGTKEEGLLEPVTLPFGSWLRSVKINNSTNGHYGEMASWQMRGVMV